MELLSFLVAGGRQEEEKGTALSGLSVHMGSRAQHKANNNDLASGKLTLYPVVPLASV